MAFPSLRHLFVEACKRQRWFSRALRQEAESSWIGIDGMGNGQAIRAVSNWFPLMIHHGVAALLLVPLLVVRNASSQAEAMMITADAGTALRLVHHGCLYTAAFDLYDTAQLLCRRYKHSIPNPFVVAIVTHHVGSLMACIGCLCIVPATLPARDHGGLYWAVVAGFSMHFSGSIIAFSKLMSLSCDATIGSGDLKWLLTISVIEIYTTVVTRFVLAFYAAFFLFIGVYGSEPLYVVAILFMAAIFLTLFNLVALLAGLKRCKSLAKRWLKEKNERSLLLLSSPSPSSLSIDQSYLAFNRLT